MKFTVAIDGPAAAGKGTIARAMAERFGFAHLDTGLLYRAVGKKALDQGRGVLDEGVAELVARDMSEQDIQSDGLRTVLVSRASSKVAAMPGVRKALLKFQQAFAEREGGAVLDGRDRPRGPCAGSGSFWPCRWPSTCSLWASSRAPPGNGRRAAGHPAWWSFPWGPSAAR